MIATIIGLCAIITGLQLSNQRRDPIRGRLIPASKQAKIFGVFHIVCGLLLIGYAVINTIIFIVEQRKINDINRVTENHIEEHFDSIEYNGHAES